MKKNVSPKKEWDPQARREQEARLRTEIRLRRQCEERLLAAQEAEREASRVAAFLAGLAGLSNFGPPEAGLASRAGTPPPRERRRAEAGHSGGVSSAASSVSSTTTPPPDTEAATTVLDPPGFRVLPEPGWQGTIQMQVQDYCTISGLPTSSTTSATTGDVGETGLSSPPEPTTNNNGEPDPTEQPNNASVVPTGSTVSSTSSSTASRQYRYFEDRFGSTDACSFVVLIALFVYFLVLPHLLPLARAQHFAPETWPDLAQRLDMPGTRERRSPVQLSASTFTAYDCTVPQNVTTISFFLNKHEQACKDEELSIKQEQKPYLLLQKARRIEIKVRECVMHTSRLAYTCSSGTNNHISLMARECYFNQPYFLNVTECRKLWKTQQFIRAPIETKLNKEHGFPEHEPTVNLTLNGTTQFPWTRIGLTRNANDDVWCYGGFFWHESMRSMRHDWELPDFTYPKDKRQTSMLNSIVVDDVILSLYERKAYVDVDEDGYMSSVLVDYNQLRLPGKLNDLGCNTTQGTYFWEVPSLEEQCTFFKVRETTGIHVTQPSDAQEMTFIAGDGALIRLQKRGSPEVACNGLVEPTEFERLYLTEDTDNPLFQRPLPPVEHSQFLFSEVADLYVYEKVQDDLARAVDEVQKQRCKETVGRDVVAYARKLAETKAVADGDTAHLGQGLYVTAAGDGGYLYYCRPITVQARPIENKCYNALPVRLLESDLEEYMYAQSGGESSLRPPIPSFYLEPKSHRLITTAAENPCLKSLPSIYRNVFGKWMAYTADGMTSIPDPHGIDANFQDRADGYVRGQIDFENYGLYDSRTIREIEIFVMARRASEAIPWNMEQTYRQKHGQRIFDGGLHLGGVTDFYYDVPGADTFSIFRSLEWFWSFLDRYGQACSMVITTAILWRFIAWILRVTMRLCSVPEVDNLLLHIANSFFPEWTEPCVRRAKRRRKQGAAGEELMRCCGVATNGDKKESTGIEDSLDSGSGMEMQTPLRAPPTAPLPPATPLYTAPATTIRVVSQTPRIPITSRPLVTTAQIHGSTPYANVCHDVQAERSRLLDPAAQRLSGIQEE